MVRLRALGAIDLRRDDGSPIAAVLRQPKRMALLTYLAASPGDLPRRRDVIVAMFWPEADDQHARDSLSAALGFLRRSLGREVLAGRGEEDIGCDPRHLSADVTEFLRAVDEHRDEDALALYQGDLAPGLHVQDAPGFEEWLERERARLRALAATVAANLAERAASDHRASEAVGYARRAAELTPDNEPMVRRLITLQNAAGDRAGALRTYETFAAWLAAEHDAKPSDETRALVARVRDHAAAARAPAAEPIGIVGTLHRGAPHEPLPAMEASAQTRAAREARRTRRLSITALAVVAVGFVMALAASDRRDMIEASGDGQPLIVVADLASSDTLLGVTAGAWLRSMLGRTPGVRTLEGEALAEALRRMRRDPMLPLDNAVARELAMREGGAGVVTGGIAKARTGYTLAVELVRADGKVLVQPGATAAGADEILTALGALGEDLHEHIVSSGMPRAAVLRPVTTSSLAALIAFTEGDRLRYNALDARAAVPYYERAIQLDSTFAMAYSQLGGAWNALGSAAPTPDTVVKLWRTAIRYADGLAPRELLAIQDRMIFAGPGERSTKFDRAVRLYQDYLRLHPEDGPALQNLSWYLKHAGRWIESETPALHAIRTGYAVAGVYDELVLAQIAAGKHAEAESSLRAWRDRHGPSQLWYRDAFRLTAARRDYAAGDSLTAEAMRDRTYDVRPGPLPLYTLAIRGRLRDAEALHVEATAQFESNGLPGSLIRQTSWFAAVRANATGDTAASLAMLHALLRRHPPATLAASARTHLYKDVGRHLALLGDTAGAGGMLASLQSNWYVYRLDHHIRGLIHEAAGRHHEAIRDLREVRYTAGHLPPLGHAYEAVGAIDSAVAVYERFLARPDSDYPAWDAVYLADVLERLGAIYASRGEGALAAARYGLLAELWREADPELQWRARRAREMAARAVRVE